MKFIREKERVNVSRVDGSNIEYAGFILIDVNAEFQGKV